MRINGSVIMHSGDGGALRDAGEGKRGADNSRRSVHGPSLTTAVDETQESSTGRGGKVGVPSG